jgi:tRNA pseudouridine38-40 synthase
VSGVSGGDLNALSIAYDGTDYAGWQLQPDAPTIQGAVEKALARVHGVAPRRIAIVGAGRTDAGVHALDQVASYAPPTERSPATLRRALAALLPESIRVLRVARAPEGFHACRSATGKTYRYLIVNRELALPFEARGAWHVRSPLDLLSMKEAARSLVGRHDFAAFATAGGQSATTVRHLRRLEIESRGGGLVRVEAEGDGFLYRMVRNVVGLLVQIGRGREPVDRARRALASGQRAEAGLSAPARGLCLAHVAYPPGTIFEDPESGVVHSGA